MLGTILLIILIFRLIGALPTSQWWVRPFGDHIHHPTARRQDMTCTTR